MQALAIDIETTSLDYTRGEIRCLGYWNREGREGVLTDGQEIAEFLRQEIVNETKFILHNGKFDQQWLYHKHGIWIPIYLDSLLAASVDAQRPDSLSLDSCAKKYLGIELDKSLRTTPDMDVLKKYCLMDCMATYQVARQVYANLKEQGTLDFLTGFLLPVGEVISRMEYSGVLVDVPLLHKQWEELNTKVQQLNNNMQRECYEYIEAYKAEKIAQAYKDHAEKVSAKKIEYMVKYPDNPEKATRLLQRIARGLTQDKLEKIWAEPFNFSSVKQVSWILDTIGLSSRDTKTKKPSTNNNALNAIKGDHPVVESLLDFRKTEKTLGYYNEWHKAIRNDGRIHASFSLVRTRTGRTSCSNPNLQQVPKGDPRKLFIPREGYRFVIADYAQIEPRVAAQLSRDPSLIKAFTSGDDFYSVLIKGVLQLPESPKEIKANKKIRDLGKVLGLSVLYGIQPFSLAADLTKGSGKDWDETQAARVISDYFAAFPGLHTLKNHVVADAVNKGYVVNIFGRHCPVAHTEASRLSVNTLIQSSASDLLLYSQVLLQKEIEYRKLNAVLVLAVHDEVVYEVKESDVDTFVPVLTDCMERRVLENVKLSRAWEVPLIAEAKVGNNWGDK